MIVINIKLLGFKLGIQREGNRMVLQVEFNSSDCIQPPRM